MPEMVLATSDDLVARLAHEGDPVRAMVELVWNSIDAEGTEITVSLERSATDAIAAVKVVDDGHGVASDEVEQTFGRIGNSWKKTAQRSKNDKRQLHGKLGEGRLRAFALGSHVMWETRAVNTAGVMQLVTITGDRSDRHRVRWEVGAWREVRNYGHRLQPTTAQPRCSGNRRCHDDVEVALRTGAVERT